MSSPKTYATITYAYWNHGPVEPPTFVLRDVDPDTDEVLCELHFTLEQARNPDVANLTHRQALANAVGRWDASQG